MFCPFCGKETNDNAVFCASCGRQMPAKAAQPAQQAQTAQQAQPVQPVESVQQNEFTQSAQQGEFFQPGAAQPVAPAEAPIISQSADAQSQQQAQAAGAYAPDEQAAAGSIIPDAQPAAGADSTAAPAPPFGDAAPQAASAMPPQADFAPPPAASPQENISPPPPPPGAAIPPGGYTSQPQTANATAADAAANAAAIKSSQLKLMIAIAAAVVLLAGGFAAAWFGGALDSVFDRGQTTVASRETDVDETTTTAAETEKTEAATTTEATTTAAATTTTATTTAATTTATTDDGANNTQTGGVIARKTSPALMALFSDLNIETHTSGDASSKGAVEETIVNLSNMLLGSARNISTTQSRGGGDVFGMQFNMALDVDDAYIEEILAIIFGPYGADPQVTEALRLAGASALGFNVEMGGEIVDSMINPVVSANVDWLVKARPFITLIGYFDLDDILVAAPGLTDKVFHMDSDMTPIPAADFEAFRSQPNMMENIGEYVDELMPSIEQMAIAAIAELDTPIEGKEELTLGGKSAEFDTIDIAITEEDASRAAGAALTVLKNDQAAQEAILNAYNDISANIDGAQTLDSRSFSLAIDGLIMQMKDNEEYAAYSEDIMRIRLYFYDGMFSGIVFSNPTDASQIGFVAVNNYGYSFWYNDFLFSEFDEVNLSPPSQKDTGIGDHFEVKGALNDGANGLSGDLGLAIREYEDEFDEKLMTFSDLNVKAMLGMPMLTGKFNVKMSDLYDAFIGKETHINEFVWQMAYAMEALDETPIFKDLEFSLELDATDKDYYVILNASDPKRNSSASITIKGFTENKNLTPPQGERIEVMGDDQTAVQAEILNIIDNVYVKIDELTAAGYDLAWLKPMIASQITGGGEFDLGGAGEFDIGDIGDAGEGDTGETGAGAESLHDLNYFLNADGAQLADYDIQGFVFENSSDEVLDPQNLLDMPLGKLYLGWTEIYARHGFLFDDVSLQVYYNQQDWYVPIYDGDPTEINEIESVNVTMIYQIIDARLSAQ